MRKQKDTDYHIGIMAASAVIMAIFVLSSCAQGGGEPGPSIVRQSAPQDQHHDDSSSKDAPPWPVDMNVAYQAGFKFEMRDLPEGEGFVSGSGRPGYKCFLEPGDKVLSSGGNGDCTVIDRNGIVFFINPIGARITIACPCPKSDSANSFHSQKDSTIHNPWKQQYIIWSTRKVSVE